MAAGPAYLVIAALLRMVVLLVGEADRIENQMVVNMPLINVGGKYRLVLATQYFFCQLHPDTIGFFCKYPLQRSSFPHSAPPLPMFGAGREHYFQRQNRLELASLYQRIRDSEIKIFQRPYRTSKSIRNPSNLHSPTMRSIPNWRRRASFSYRFLLGYSPRIFSSYKSFNCKI